MENYIPISFLNDFLFCPRSIYYHQLYRNFNDTIYKQTPQYLGSAAHNSIDNETYSTRAHILQNHEVYCEKYQLCGKIDIFDIKKKRLTERKRSIKKIYDGQIFQVYAQYFALTEMGYEIEELRIYDASHNKNYLIDLPDKNPELLAKFEDLIVQIQSFDLLKTPHSLVLAKCQNCIYSTLCDRSLC